MPRIHYLEAQSLQQGSVRLGEVGILRRLAVEALLDRPPITQPQPHHLARAYLVTLTQIIRSAVVGCLETSPPQQGSGPHNVSRLFMYVTHLYIYSMKSQQ
jgi:hypothetical protein